MAACAVLRFLAMASLLSAATNSAAFLGVVVVGFVLHAAGGAGRWYPAQWGFNPRRLPAAIGGDMAGVYTVRTLADVDAMRDEFQPGRRVIIVGGGIFRMPSALSTQIRAIWDRAHG